MTGLQWSVRFGPPQTPNASEDETQDTDTGRSDEGMWGNRSQVSRRAGPGRGQGGQ